MNKKTKKQIIYDVIMLVLWLIVILCTSIMGNISRIDYVIVGVSFIFSLATNLIDDITISKLKEIIETQSNLIESLERIIKGDADE